MVFAYLVIGCSQDSTIRSLNLDIAELVCMDGQNLLESRILELKGIRSVSTNISTHKAEIQFRDAESSEELILNHLRETGFTVNGTAGDEAAYRRLPSCCKVNE